ncbi:MAG: NUDIX domain-containing protein [Candidatus Saccharibacteria bacterium]|nr:NUDIX domain-containing protein [Candidatus Saccharibacteria bacterium]
MSSDEMLNKIGAIPAAHLSRILKHFVEIDKLSEPERCRAIILDKKVSHIASIRRVRMGRQPYCVIPGGGIEQSDDSPVDAVRREIYEELSLTPEDYVIFEDRVLPIDDQWIYLGVLNTQPKPELVINGPESNPDASSGSYEAIWLPLDSIHRQNLVPEEVVGILDESFDPARILSKQEWPR